MPNRDVIRSQKAAEAVVLAAETNLSTVTEDLQRRLSTLGIDPGIETPGPVEGAEIAAATETPEVGLDVEALQRFAARVISRARDRLVAADDRLDQERHGDDEPRLRRDEAAASLYAELTRTRQSLSQAMGVEAAARIFAIQGETPRDPVTLLRVVQRMIPKLEDPATHFPDLKVDGMAQDWATLAAGLRREAQPLVEALREVNVERRRAELALEARNQALEEFRDIYVGFTRILDGTYVASGHRGLARRLRPTVPRGSGLEEVDEDGDGLPDASVNSNEPEAPGASDGSEDEETTLPDRSRPTKGTSPTRPTPERHDAGKSVA